MNQSASHAEDHQPHHFHDKGQEWVSFWHPPDQEPEGKSHGSAAVCFVPSTEIGGEVVIGSAGGRHGWELPGGRPEPNEDWRTTLDREVLEEVCARVDSAKLLGFISGECLSGPEQGLVLVRSLWVAQVSLLPWEPKHEIVHRKIVIPEVALEMATFPAGQLSIYRRWFDEAVAALVDLDAC